MNKLSKIFKRAILVSALTASSLFAVNLCNMSRGDFQIVYVANGQSSFLDSLVDLVSIRESFHGDNIHHELFYGSANSGRFVDTQTARLNSLRLQGNRVVLISDQRGVNRFITDIDRQSMGTVVLRGPRSSNIADQIDSTVVNRFLTTLVVPSTTVSNGFFTVTMTWDGYGDVDLHTFEPSGTHVYYRNKRGVSGYLDRDNTYANGPEHYFASCDSNKLREGIYEIKLRNYGGANGRVATVQVSSANGGELFTKRVPVGLGELKPVVKVRVSKQNGHYGVSVINSREARLIAR